MATLPSPRTWVAGEKATATLLNAEVRDALSFLLDPPTAYAYLASNQNIPTGIGSFEVLNLAGEEFDNDTMHSTVTNNSRLTVKTAGLYLFMGAITFATETTNANRAARIRLNGSDILNTVRYRNANASTSGIEVSAYALLSVNDYVELLASQDSGSTVQANSGNTTTFFWGRWMGTG